MKMDLLVFSWHYTYVSPFFGRVFVLYVLILWTTLPEAALALLYSQHNALMHFISLASLPMSTMVVWPVRFVVHIGHNCPEIQNLSVLFMGTSLIPFSRYLMTQLPVSGCIGAPFFAQLAMMMMIQLTLNTHHGNYVFTYLYCHFSLLILLSISSQVHVQQADYIIIFI